MATLVLVMLILQQARFLELAVAQTNNLTVGDILTPPNYIVSPSGDFAFGFLRLRAAAAGSDPDPATFILVAWCRFVGDDDNSSAPPQPQSVVWFAKESSMGATATATARSMLISIPKPDGQLTLTDGSGSKELWKAMASGGRVVVLRDSGNVQFLGDGGGDGEVLWEIFAYPTDTLLPGQSLQGALFSKRSDAEFTTGRFSLAAQNDGNVVLCMDLFTGDIKQNAYWATYTNGPDGNTSITFGKMGYLNYTLYGGEEVFTLISPVAATAVSVDHHHHHSSSHIFLQRLARIDPDGVVRTYVRSRNEGGNTSWTVSGTLDSGGCSMKTGRLQGMCGPGSYCVETKERLNCVCPPGYTYVDAQHRDSGCTPEFEPQRCGGDESSSFSLVELPNTTWEITIYYKKFPSVTEQQCRDYCLGDCYCTAALMINGSDCAEVGALTYGRQGNDVLTTALIKVRNGTRGRGTNFTDMRPPTAAAAAAAAGMMRTTRRHYYMIVVIICLAFVSLVTVGVLLAQYLARNRNRNRTRSSLQSSLSSGTVRAFSWKELYQATNGFKELLGKGSFGEVYKGTLTTTSPSPSPQPNLNLIAVKKLIDSNDYSEQEFTNEVQSVGQIHHRNLVRMLGYCKQGKHRMLVFEFMRGGSLRSLLFQPGKPRPQWRWRAEAALAIARGIEYLHDGCAVPIIDCDIKPDNVLVDGHGVPRITDFGISKLLGGQQVRTTVTHVRGTRGYIAPEWLRCGDARVDTKVDVYSYGVVLLELISCRRCQDPVVDYLPPGAQDDDDETTTVTLFGWAAQLVVARKTELLLLHGGDADDDDIVVGTPEDTEQLELFARVALWCMEPNPQLRPTMHQVVQLLESSDWAQVHALPDPADCYMESSPLIPQLVQG